MPRARHRRGFPCCHTPPSSIRADALPPEAFGGPIIVASRPALHGALLETVGLDTLRFGSEITGFAADGNRVAIRTVTGDTTEGDLLIGADGVGSAIRRALFPSEPPPRPCGIVGVRGASASVHHLGDLSAVMYLGPGLESMLVRSGDTSIYWFLSLAREIVPSDTRDPNTILEHMSPRMDLTFRAVTSETEELRCDELCDRAPLRRWSEGVVTLLGDAPRTLSCRTRARVRRRRLSMRSLSAKRWPSVRM